MPANTRNATARCVPGTARGNGPEPTPAAREWFGSAAAATVFAGVAAIGPLHRIERWKRGGDGFIHARCGAKAALWFAPGEPHRPRCLSCEDVDDARKAA